MSHPHWLKFIESFISRHPHDAHVSFSLIFTCVLFYFHLSFTVFFLTCTPTSTTWTPGKITCATPPRGPRRQRRRPLPHRIQAQRHGLQRVRRLPGSLRLRFSVIGPGHMMTLRSASCSPKHTEYVDYRSLEGVFVSQASVFVASDRTGKLVGESDP